MRLSFQFEFYHYILTTFIIDDSEKKLEKNIENIKALIEIHNE